MNQKTIIMKREYEKENKNYAKDTENNFETQEIKTSEKRKVEDSNKEILIGKDLDEVENVKEFNSLQRKILNKLT